MRFLVGDVDEREQMMGKWWGAVAREWASESLLEEADELSEAASTGPVPSRARRRPRWRRRRVPALLAVVLTAGVTLLATGVAFSAGPSPFTWSAPQQIDNSYPFSAPNSVNSISCSTSSLCVGTTGPLPAEIFNSTDPTGTAASNWSVLPTSLLAQNATGYSLSGASCLTAGASPYCLATGEDPGAIPPAPPGLALASTNPTGGAAADWKPSQLADSIFFGPSCAHRSSATICIVASFTDLFVSTTPDGGSPTWTEITTPFGTDADIAGVSCAANSDITMCGAVSGGGAFLSSNNPTSAGSWDQDATNTEETDISSLSCPTTTFCMVSGQANGGPISTNAGGSSQWTVQTTTGLPNPAGIVECSPATDPTTGDPICFAGESGNVLTSTDGGDNWSAQPIGGPDSDTPTSFSCTSTTQCFAGTQGGAVTHSSTVLDGASGTWSTPVGAAGGHTPISAGACPSSALCVAGDGEGRILTSTNPTAAGPSWASGIVDRGDTISEVDCPSTSLCVATANGNSSSSGAVTDSTSPSDGAGTWRPPDQLDANSRIDLLQCPNTSLCVAADEAGNIVTSTSPGTGAWTGPGSVGLTGAGQLQCPDSSLCVAENEFSGDIAWSTNPSGGSTTWSSASIDGDLFPTGLQCPSSKLCIATDDAGNLFTSTNPGGGGTTWVKGSPDGTTDIDRLECPSVNLCVAIDEQNNMLVSTDPAGGAGTWSKPAAIDATNVLIDQLVCKSDALCLLDDSSGNVLVSTDPAGGASTWSAPDSVDPNGGSFTGIACPSSTSCLLADETGHIVPGAASASSPPPPSGAPSVVSLSPPTVSSSGAALSGLVNPEGLQTTAHFEVGLDPKYAGGGPVTYTQSTPSQVVGSDFSAHEVSATVSGLLPNALYHVRLVASNTDGTVDGRDLTFTTAKERAPGAPTLGKTANITPVSGLVFVKPPKGQTIHSGRVEAGAAAAAIPKGQGFIPLTQARQVPIGSQIDALRGTLKLVVATAKKRQTQAAKLSGSVFGLGQNRSGAQKGLTTFTLKENAFKGAPSYTSCKATKKKTTLQPLAQIAKLSSKVLQTLRASDNHGKFRTKGRYSAATVRGTIWGVEDRCDGTLTKVTRGKVSVQDFHTRKTITLHAGHSFLARAF